MKHKLKAVATRQHARLNFGTVQEILSKLNIKKHILNEQGLRWHPVLLCDILEKPFISIIGFQYNIFVSYRFESCWPALMKDSSGVVIIFNPDVPSHLKEIETWHSMFISSQGLQDNQCLLIAHHKPGSGVEDRRLQLGTSTAGLPKQF